MSLHCILNIQFTLQNNEIIINNCSGLSLKQEVKKKLRKGAQRLNDAGVKTSQVDFWEACGYEVKKSQRTAKEEEGGGRRSEKRTD